jgi:hypothetical protein
VEVPHICVSVRVYFRASAFFQPVVEHTFVRCPIGLP